MAKINVDPVEFPDIIMAFLFDKILHPDEIVPGNDEFDKIMKIFKQKGMVTNFRDYYLDMNKDNRRKYKLIKKSLQDESTSSGVISIVPPGYEKERKKKKESRIKKILKKLVASTEFSDAEKQLVEDMFNE